MPFVTVEKLSQSGVDNLYPLPYNKNVERETFQPTGITWRVPEWSERKPCHQTFF